MDVMNRDLKVMDATAIAFCRDNKIPIVVFDMSAAGALRSILTGRPRGDDRVVRPLSGRYEQRTRFTARRGMSASVPGYSVVVIDETLLDAMEKMDKAVEHVQN